MEVSGLVLVVAVGLRFWGAVGLLDVPVAPDGTSGLTLALVMQGSILTFFSFLGFEDMLNVAEEVKQPNRNMPIAVIGAMLVASAIYIAVAITAVSVVEWHELSQAPAPLKLVMERAAPWFPAVGFVIITIAAVANTALVNFVMGSRLLYGMANQDLLPEAIGAVHGKRQTPHIAIAIILGVVILLQLAGQYRAARQRDRAAAADRVRLGQRRAGGAAFPRGRARRLLQRAGGDPHPRQRGVRDDDRCAADRRGRPRADDRGRADRGDPGAVPADRPQARGGGGQVRGGEWAADADEAQHLRQESALPIL